MAIYEKVGRGNLIKMLYPRIVASQFDLGAIKGELTCPNCGQGLAKKGDYRGRDTLWVIRGRINTKRL